MKKPIFFSILILSIFSLLLASCGGSAATPAAGSGGNEPPAGAANGGEIWIALVYPMTGDNAQFGEIEVRAHKYVIDTVNAQGGIDGKMVKYEVFDDQGDPQQAATIAQRVVGDPRFIAVFGHYRSVCTLAAAPIYNESKFLLLTDSINEKISGISPYVFRYSLTDAEAGKQMVWAAIKNHPEYKNAAILYTQSDFGVGLNSVVSAELQKLGINIVATESYFEGQSKDYTPQLTKIKAAKPDIIFELGYYPEGALIAKQSHQLGMNVPIWGPDGLNNQGLIDLGGADVENNVFVTAYFSSGLDYPRVAEVTKDFQEKIGMELDGFSALSLDGTQLLMDALKAVGPDKVKLQEWLASQKDFVGVSGPIVFDAKNDNTMRHIVVLKVVDGKFVPADEQVPDEYFKAK